MVLSPSQRPPYPLRSDRCTAPCTRRSSAGHGTHAERHCRSADHQDLPSMHQIPPRHPPRTSVIRHSLESDESEPRNRKVHRQVNSKCDSPDVPCCCPLRVSQKSPNDWCFETRESRPVLEDGGGDRGPGLTRAPLKIVRNPAIENCQPPLAPPDPVGAAR